MEEELLLDLTTELRASDEDFNSDILRSKIKSAIREVEMLRQYPDYYTDKQIENDLYKFYANIRNLALYDYSKVGAEGEQSHNENGYTRVYESRRTVFNGIIPIARM